MALIALGVTGGIGAYKAVEVARGLQKAGHDVVAVMTRNARRFVGPVTFEAITRRPVVTSQWAPGINADVEHIALASGIDLLLVVPATANIIGKFANGIADDFLSTMFLATRAPVMLAPSMNTNMLEHPAVAENLRVLSSRGVLFVEPGAGYLACGWVGKGRLAEPDEIVAAADALVRPDTSLSGVTTIVTAGPTFEAIDPVRFLGNRSSGRMGFALAAEAHRRGAHVVLVAGPTSVPPPGVAETVRVQSASEMHDAVLGRVADADVVIMAAAVADYQPERYTDHKIKKTAGAWTLALRPTPDILAALGEWRAARGGRRPVLVGFAAETAEPAARARQKLSAKGADLIVANDVSQPGAGFEVETNIVTLVTANGAEPLPLMSKTNVARIVLDRIIQLIADAAATRDVRPVPNRP
jgi:phosphopantothenoylcysteine decarboxylase/phosphopantothenate--cysteine ligase